jgi:protein SCO1/2
MTTPARLMIGLGETCLLAGAARAVPGDGAGRADRPIVPDVRIEQRLDEQVPLDLRFRDEDGTTRPLSDYFHGKPVVLVPAYYRCPRLCSLVLNGVADVLRRVDYEPGTDYEIVTFSIDPAETPELARAKKAAYVEHVRREGAGAAWHFLTGAEPEIKRLTDAVGFRYAYDPVRGEYAHASGLMVLTPDGRVSRYFYGMNFSSRDVAFALEDASAGKIGSPAVYPLRLLCFNYDPTTGQYTLMVFRVVQLAGIVTVVAGGAWLAVAVWRERRRARASGPTRPSGERG